MKITCTRSRDLLPLCVEQGTRGDSRVIIEEHLKESEACQHTLQEMTAFGQLPVETKASPRLKLKSLLHRKKPQIVMLFLMMILALVVYALAVLTTPEYLPYDKGNVTVNENGNGSVLIRFGEEVSGFNLNRAPSEEKGKVVYSLTTYDSLWNRIIAKTHIDSVVLNEAGESVAALYYVGNDSSEDLLIYGKNPNPNGGVMTLPRLILGYYARIALWLIMTCIFVLILFKRHKKVTDLTIKVLFLSVSYLLGQFLIKGLKTSSYDALRDFYFILFMTIPIYIAFFIVMNLYKTTSVEQSSKD